LNYTPNLSEIDQSVTELIMIYDSILVVFTDCPKTTSVFQKGPGPICASSVGTLSDHRSASLIIIPISYSVSKGGSKLSVVKR